MTYLGNTPPQDVVLRLERAKSFALGLTIRDSRGVPVNVTGVAFTIVMKKNYTDPTNLITNFTAQAVDVGVGQVRFNLQASDFNAAAGEYVYTITMIASGFSTTVVRGTVELLPNPDLAPVGSTYAPANPPLSLVAQLDSGRVLQVFTGYTLLPNTAPFSLAEQTKLAGIEAGAKVNVRADWNALVGDAVILNKPGLGSAAFQNVEDIAVPPVGTVGNVLMKIGSGSTQYAWATPPTQPAGNLDATGVVASKVPLSNGANSWSWQTLSVPVTSVAAKTGNITLDLNDIADTAGKVSMLPAERTKLSGLTATPDWSVLLNKPAFGTAALQNSTAFIAPGAVNATTDILAGTVNAARLPKLTSLQGYSQGTAAPAGGADGDFYFQYT